MTEAGTDARGHIWPSASQRLLLKAALDPTAQALGAFAEWQAQVDVESAFGSGSLRLLPLVYDNLTALGSTDPLLGRMKGVYRRSWYTTNRLFHDVRPALQVLVDAGIDVVLLKGAPLALTYYRNAALRPMADVDVWVPPDRAQEAVRILSAADWRAGGRVDRHLVVAHATQLIHAGGGEIDLHWYASKDRLTQSANEWFWTNAEPLDFQGIAVRQLGGTEMLALTVLHGLRWNVETPIRWIADAMIVLRARGADIQWERLIELARRHADAGRLALGLDYLSREFGATVPTEVLSALRSRRLSSVERIERFVRPLEERSTLRFPGVLAQHADIWCRTVDPTARFALVAGTRRYITVRVDAIRAAEGGLGRAMARRARRRLQGLARRILSTVEP